MTRSGCSSRVPRSLALAVVLGGSPLVVVACTVGTFAPLEDAAPRTDGARVDARPTDASVRDAARPDVFFDAGRSRRDQGVDREAPTDVRDALVADVRAGDGSADGAAGGAGFCATALADVPSGAYVVCDDFDEAEGTLVAAGSSLPYAETAVRDSPPKAEYALADVDAGSASSYFEAEVASGQAYSIQIDFELGHFDADPSSLALLVDVVFGGAANASQVGVELVPSSGGGVSALEVYETEPMGAGSVTVAHAPTAVSLPASSWSRLLVQIYAVGGIWKDLVTLSPTSATPVVIESGILSAGFANAGVPTVEVGLPATTGGGIRHVFVDNVLIESSAN
jgi:hypothetical protein